MIWQPKDSDDYRIVVIPEDLHALIEKRLDEAIAEHPEAEKDREFLRNHLMRYVDEFGEVPSFSLSKKPESPDEGGSNV